MRITTHYTVYSRCKWYHFSKRKVFKTWEDSHRYLNVVKRFFKDDNAIVAQGYAEGECINYYHKLNKYDETI